MPSTINASTASGGGIISSADSSGVLELQTAGTSALIIETTGNINIPGTGKRITGDFGNATIANRVAFQTSTANQQTSIGVIPNGTSTSANLNLFGGTDPANASIGQLVNTGTEVRLGAIITGTGTFLPLTMYTGGSERLRIDTSGNVGIGTSSPSYRLQVSNSGYPAVGVFRALDVGSVGTAGQAIELGALNGSTPVAGAAVVGNLDNPSTTGSLTFQTRSSNTLTERMRIDSSGNLCVGLTTTVGNGLTSFQGVAASEGVLALRNSGATGTTWRVGPNSGGTFVIYNQNSNGVYLISGQTSWTANSDERLKTNLKPFQNAAEKISSLRAGTGRYLTDDESVSRSFLIAQDVKAVLPEAVDVQPNEQGTLGLRYQDLIPLLTAAIQEQQAIITDLKARIETLESK